MDKKMNALLDKYDAKIKELEAEGRLLSAEAKQSFDQNINKLKLKRDELKNQSESLLASASEDAADLKKRLKAAARELKIGTKQAKRQLKNK